ncbi:MAG: glutathione S-transferase [Gammaproteobacteria bacterium]|nr:MAG: glutathione S-transferase [Gammaproteobacteria bacterium]
MSNRLPILYSFRRCPYAMRARMAIKTAGISVEQIEVSLKHKPRDLLECSPKGTVPVLVTLDGEVIEQSRDIMSWALQKSDPGNWLLKENDLKQQAMTQLVDKCDFEFKPFLDRYKYFDRYPEESQEEYRSRAENFLTELNTALSKHAFLIDDNMRFADAAIFPFIRQFAAVDMEWFKQSSYTHVQRWLEVCVGTETFLKIMEKQRE